MGLSDFWNDHSPEILTGASIVGFLSTIALSIRATPSAHDIVIGARKDIQRARTDEEVKEIKKETIKDLGKLYLPALISAAATTACIIGSNRISSGRQAALASAYTLSNKALMDYQDEVRRTFGEKKEQEVRQRVIEREVDEQMPKNSNIFITGDGNYLCYDKLCKVKFRSNIGKVKEGILNLNIKLQDEMDVTVSDLYSEWGVPTSYASDKLHWRVDKTRKIEEYYIPEFDDETGEPMMVIDYYTKPE